MSALLFASKKRAVGLSQISLCLMLVGFFLFIFWTPAKAGEPDVELLLQLWGTEVTIGELKDLGLIPPDILGRINPEAWETKVTWGPKSGGGVTLEFCPEEKGASAAAQGCIWTYSYSSLSGPYPYFLYSSETLASQPLWFIEVTSYLYRGWWDCVDSTSDFSWNTLFVRASSVYIVDKDGNYRTVGQHYMEPPPGYFPPAGYVITLSNWVSAP